jgi:hypothetical protein
MNFQIQIYQENKWQVWVRISDSTEEYAKKELINTRLRYPGKTFKLVKLNDQSTKTSENL